MVLRVLIGLVAFGLIVACNPIPAGLPLSDTDVVAPAAATATAGVLAQEKGGYIHPKLIGPEWKLERVNQSDTCAPPAGKPLPENCKGKYWRSYNVIVMNRDGKRISQSIDQYGAPHTGLSQIPNEIDVTKRVNSNATYTETPTDNPVPGSMILIGSNDHVEVMSPKADFLVTVLIFGQGKEPQDQTVALATRVVKMLWDKVPDKLGGPVPNPDYWGNKYWVIR